MHTYASRVSLSYNILPLSKYIFIFCIKTKIARHPLNYLPDMIYKELYIIWEKYCIFSRRLLKTLFQIHVCPKDRASSLLSSFTYLQCTRMGCSLVKRCCQSNTSSRKFTMHWDSGSTDCWVFQFVNSNWCNVVGPSF